MPETDILTAPWKERGRMRGDRAQKCQSLVAGSSHAVEGSWQALEVFATEPEDFTKLDITTMKGIKRTAGPVTRLRELASHQTVVLLDYTTNGDVTALSAPLSHAALIAQCIEAPAHARPVQADDR